MPTNDTLPTPPPARGATTLLLFRLEEAIWKVQAAQDEVRRCAEAARIFYGDAQWTKERAIPYQTRHGQLQAVMDALAAEGQLLQRGDDVCGP